MSEEKVLTKEIANQFLADPVSVDLTEFTSIEDRAAEQLATHDGSLDLKSLTTLSDTAAESLAKHEGMLHLIHLNTASNLAAEKLIKHRGPLTISPTLLHVLQQAGDSISGATTDTMTKQRDNDVLEVPCKHCRLAHTILADREGVLKWIAGEEYNQDALDHLTAAERELLLSGTCDNCWKKMYGEDLNEDEDDYTEDDESDDGSLGSAEGNSECVQQFLKCQENTAEDLFGDPNGIVINSIGMRLIPVAPGSFGMGDKEADESETKGYPIEITKPFYLGMFQVTQGEYVPVMGENPSFYKGKNRPVEHLSWEQAANFCKALSDLAAEKAAGRKYRLPTEAEWEYACRAGTDSGFNNGQDSIDCSEAKFSNHCGQDSPQPTLPVGSFKPNNWGFYDMHGNVWEWCADWFDEGYYEDCPKCDPTGPRSGNHHTLRGGAASNAAFECSSFYRGEASTNDGPTYDLPADGRFEDLGDFGLRVVCELADGIS